MPILVQKRLWFMWKPSDLILALNYRQQLALQVARIFRTARKQLTLHQEGTGRHNDTFIHSGSFLRWLVTNLWNCGV